MMFRTITTKILVLQIGLILSVAIGLGTLSYLIAFSSLKDNQRLNLVYKAMDIAIDVNSVIEQKKEQLAKIANDEVVESYHKKEQDLVLAEYFSRYSNYLPLLSYADENGIVKLKMSYGNTITTGSDISHNQIFKEAIANPNKVFSSYRPLCSSINEPVVEFCISNVNFFDEFTGVIFSCVPISVLMQNFKIFINAEPSRPVILLDSSGTILACSDKDKIFKKITINRQMLKNIIGGIKAGRTDFGHAVISGMDCYFAYSPVPGQDMFIMAIIPYQEFVSKLNVLRNTVILASIFILVAGVILSIVVSEDITRPVCTLLESTNIIATGDFSQRVHIDSKDEVGQLAYAFNQMAENLQKTTTSMESLNKEVVERQKAESEQHRLNVILARSIKDLTIANRELSDFTNITAHDLKAPLRAIGSLAGILLADYGHKLDEHGKYYLDTLIKRTERMSDLISGIVIYSELNNEITVQPVNLKETIDEVIANTNVPENIQIAIEGDFPRILCGKIHIYQIFENLISNAIKFIDKSQGYIRVKCAEENAHWVFSVSDNGCGIEEKYYDRIFKIFQTLIRRDERESTGIGLSIAKRIIEKYNGKIWVESQPDVGSTFFFTLPRAEMEVTNEELQTNTVS